MTGFKDVKIKHVPREQNSEANDLAQLASGYRVAVATIDVANISTEYQRIEITTYLRDPSYKVDKKIMYKSLKYGLLDDHLYYRMINGTALRPTQLDEN